jgi:hypothetical protein
MPQGYLKCKYFEKAPMLIYPREYMVTFKCLNERNPKVVLGNDVFPPDGEEWCMVSREDVVRLEETRGLVRLVTLKRCEDEKNAVVGIRDTGDRRISFYKVPKEDVEIK